MFVNLHTISNVLIPYLLYKLLISPLSDLNPIENLWSIIKINVEKPKKISDLRRFMVNEWDRYKPVK